MSTIKKNIHDNLVKLGIIVDGKVRENGKSLSAGFMDLVLERMSGLDDFNTRGTIAFSLAHYFEQAGDLCCDPDMVIFYHPDTHIAEAHSFEMAIPPLLQVVYPDPGKLDRQKEKELNEFLCGWLNTLIQQGHGEQWESNGFEEETEEAPLQINRWSSSVQLADIAIIETLTTRLNGTTVLYQNACNSSIVLDLDEARNLDLDGSCTMPVEEITQCLIEAGMNVTNLNAISHLELSAR